MTASRPRPRAGTLAAAVALIAVASTIAPAARAQDANQERIAETLFQEARALVKAGQYREACPKFAASQKASPSTGTELNLADCYEKSGATASAWALYIDVARAAARENRRDRETIAKTRATALEPRLARMKIVVSTPGVEVRRNGAVVDPALLGSAEPMDAGSYTLEVSASGKKTWTQVVTLADGQPPLVVSVPELDAKPAVTPAAPPASGTDTTPAATPPSSNGAATPAAVAQPGGSSPLRTVGFVVGAAGIAGFGVGAAFGFVAMSKQSSAGCPKNVCPTDAAAQTIRDAEGAGTISTIAFVAGGVLAAAGIAFVVVAPRAEGTPAVSLKVVPSVTPGTAGLTMGGTF